MSPKPKSELASASLEWTEEGVPRSSAFDDVYFSVQDGLAETRYVFLQGNKLAERFRETSMFTIAELGFGTGLNFLATTKLWRETTDHTQSLSYYSIEQYPLEKGALESALSSFPELQEEAGSLIENYPRLLNGVQHLSFPRWRVDLYLVFEEVSTGLEQLLAPVDAWYLDGFAPSKNPEMWSEKVFAEIGRTSGQSSSFATFSSARVVKDRASKAGFELEKHPGFGKKREMLTGVKKTESRGIEKTLNKESRRVITAAVIGGGLAGASAAFSLARRGVSVQLFERENELARHASGNSAGIYMAYVAKQDTPTSRLNRLGFDFLRRQLKELKAQGRQISGEECGVQHLATTERLLGLHALLKEQGAPAAVAKALSAEEASELLGIEVELPSIYYPEGGWLSPRDYTQALLAEEEYQNLKLHLGQVVSELRQEGKRWQLISENAEILTEVDMVVLASAYEASNFSQCQSLPIGKIRGQTMNLPSSSLTNSLRQVLCYDGYIVPEFDGAHFLGSTYDKLNESTETFSEQEEELLQRLSRRVASFKKEELKTGPGRAAFRTTSPDRLPLVGEHSKHRGLFLTLCHGSRGIITSAISAEVLAAEMLGIPAPLDKDTLRSIHPLRYLNKL